MVSMTCFKGTLCQAVIDLGGSVGRSDSGLVHYASGQTLSIKEAALGLSAVA